VVHQDGGGSGHPRALAASAPRTIVATSNTAATPTILAARREMQSWRILALEPSALRRADPFHAPPHIDTSGHHLPAALYRLGSESGRERERIHARIAARLAGVVPVRDLHVEVDEVRRLLSLVVRESDGRTLPARSLADGTLRFLALCILQEDAAFHGLVCLEEPENGVHPARMQALVDLLRAFPVATDRPPCAANPLRQLVVATHSPFFVQLQNRDDLLFATEVEIPGPQGRPARTLRCRPRANTWRSEGTSDPAVEEGVILDYFKAPPNTQASLPFEIG